MTTQTKFAFTLPHGYEERDGALYRTGVMRMAKAADEIAPLKDPRVQANPAYLVIILLARVVELDGLEHMNPKVIEDLYAGDLAYLQDMYRRINTSGHNRLLVQCPHCEQKLAVELESLGGT